LQKLEALGRGVRSIPSYRMPKNVVLSTPVGIFSVAFSFLV
jgi:hypothetical protein